MSKRTADTDAENLYIADNTDQLRKLGDTIRNKHRNLPPNTGNETEKLLIKTTNGVDVDGYRDDQRQEHPDREPVKSGGLKDLID